MPPRVDWKGGVRELRLLVTQLQPARFFALYVLLFIVAAAYVVGYIADKLGRIQ
jgi:hypothetical protein